MNTKQEENEIKENTKEPSNFFLFYSTIHFTLHVNVCIYLTKEVFYSLQKKQQILELLVCSITSLKTPNKCFSLLIQWFQFASGKKSEWKKKFLLIKTNADLLHLRYKLFAFNVWKTVVTTVINVHTVK